MSLFVTTNSQSNETQRTTSPDAYDDMFVVTTGSGATVPGSHYLDALNRLRSLPTSYCMVVSCTYTLLLHIRMYHIYIYINIFI